MARITETRLPGVGVRFDFTSSTGQRIGVIAHDSGRRELIVCGSEDPDTCRDVVRLDEDDARTLAEILGQSQVTEELDARRLQLYGLTVDWLPVSEGSACSRCTVHEIEHVDQSAASIVAVVRGGEIVPTPPSTFALQPGDTAVVIGTADGVRRLFELLGG